MTPAPLPSHILDKKFRPRPETKVKYEADEESLRGQVMTTAVLAVTTHSALPLPLAPHYSGHSLSVTTAHCSHVQGVPTKMFNI